MSTGANMQDAYNIYVRGDTGNSDGYRYIKFSSSSVLNCTANHVYGLRVFVSSGTYDIVAQNTCIQATYLK